MICYILQVDLEEFGLYLNYVLMFFC